MTGTKRSLSGESQVSECKRPCNNENNVQSPQVPTSYRIPKMKSKVSSPTTPNNGNSKLDPLPGTAGTVTQRPSPEVTQQSVSNGINHAEAGRLPPEVSFYKQIGTVKITPPFTELPSPDHDYSVARPRILPKLAPAPAPVTANNGILILPGQLSSAVNPEDPTPAPAPAPAKKGRQANPRTTRTGQSKKNYSETHQYDNKGKEKGKEKEKGKKGNNPKRYALCQECEGCRAPDCESCKSCSMWTQYKEQITLGKPTCDKRVCLNPIDLYNTRVKSANGKPGPKQEDGCCPLKVIKGSVYDFRCVFCKHLPRVGSANRSELYRHYSVYHYQNELTREFGRNMKRCPICKDLVSGSSVSHVGQTHNEVDKYLPASAKIPSSVQGKGGARRRRMKGVLYCLTEEFPRKPPGWNPATREIEDEDTEEKPNIILDGIEEIIDDEEPLFVSREDPVTMPDYSGDSALCGICKMNGKHSYFNDIVDAVLHVHRDHEVLGGSQILMLDADRMLKAGYLSLTAQVPDVETPPAETVKSEETSGSETNQNIVDVLHSQVQESEVQADVQSNYLSALPSQVAV